MFKSHRKSPLQNEFLMEQNERYSVSMARHLGEACLSAMAAKTTDTEYTFTYDRAEAMWHHHPAKRVAEEFECKPTAIMGGRRVAYKAPRYLLVPATDTTSFYHTHPSVAHFAVDRRVHNQIPSNEDIQSAFRLTLAGYEDSRIVTERGVTVMSVDKLAVGALGKTTLPGFTIAGETIEAAMKERGVDYAIKQTLDVMSQGLSGLIKFDYVPLDTSRI